MEPVAATCRLPQKVTEDAMASREPKGCARKASRGRPLAKRAKAVVMPQVGQGRL
jgi:hypothetical protein